MPVGVITLRAATARLRFFRSHGDGKRERSIIFLCALLDSGYFHEEVRQCAPRMNTPPPAIRSGPISSSSFGGRSRLAAGTTLPSSIARSQYASPPSARCDRIEHVLRATFHYDELLYRGDESSIQPLRNHSRSGHPPGLFTIVRKNSHGCLPRAAPAVGGQSPLRRRTQVAKTLVDREHVHPTAVTSVRHGTWSCSLSNPRREMTVIDENISNACIGQVCSELSSRRVGSQRPVDAIPKRINRIPHPQSARRDLHEEAPRAPVIVARRASRFPRDASSPRGPEAGMVLPIHPSATRRCITLGKNRARPAASAASKPRGVPQRRDELSTG